MQFSKTPGKRKRSLSQGKHLATEEDITYPLVPLNPPELHPYETWRARERNIREDTALPNSVVVRNFEPRRKIPRTRQPQVIIDDEPQPAMEDAINLATMSKEAFNAWRAANPDGPTVYDDVDGRSMPSRPMVLTAKGRKRMFYRTKRGRRVLAKRRSLFRDAMNWRRMRAKVFNRLYTTYGRARRYSTRRKYYRRRFRR